MATIASANHKSAGFASAGLSGASLLAPFRAFGRAVIALAEASPQMRALNRLNQVSDAELGALGTTREREIRRILGGAAVL